MIEIKPCITLRACRANANMSMSEWAARLGVTTGTASNWESGRTDIPGIKLQDVARLACVPLELIILPRVSD